MTKRFWNLGLTAMAVGLVVAGIGSSLAYPTKPITLIVPFPPSGCSGCVSGLKYRTKVLTG